MAQFTKPFRGVPNGEIYGRDFAPGEDCPPELEAAAREAGALSSEPAPLKSARKGGAQK